LGLIEFSESLRHLTGDRVQPVPDRAQLAQQRRRLQTGSQADLEELTAWLVEHGFQRRDAVFQRYVVHACPLAIALVFSLSLWERVGVRAS